MRQKICLHAKGYFEINYGTLMMVRVVMELSICSLLEFVAFSAGGRNNNIFLHCSSTYNVYTISKRRNVQSINKMQLFPRFQAIADKKLTNVDALELMKFHEHLIISRLFDGQPFQSHST